MVAAVGFLMIIAIVILLLKGKMSPIVVLAVIPSIAALLLGHGPIEIAGMIKDGVSTTTSNGILFIFSVIYFGVLSDTGLFDIIVNFLVKLAGSNVIAGPFRVDLRKMECFMFDELLNFTGRELNLFRFLLDNPGQVFSKEQLYRQVWNDAVVDDNTITVYIKRIRSKIEKDPKKPVYLKTVRGIGYRLDLDD